MARLARVVAPGLPHHITQRANLRQQAFFCDEDYQSYLELIGQWCGAFDVEIWAYCLMPNHVHLILHSHEHAGRPLAEEAFLATLEINPGRILRRQEPGPKPGLPS